MKKIFSLMVVASALVAVVGCGDDKKDSKGTGTKSTATSTATK